MQTASMLQTSLVRPRCLQAKRANVAGSNGRSVQHICCAHRARETPDRLSLTLASCAAALLLQSSPAEAKVIFEKGVTKKVFQDSGDKVKEAASSVGDNLPSFNAPSLPSAPSLPGVPSLPTFKGSLPKFQLTTDSGDIDPRAVALPGALLLIGGGGLLLSKLDPQFDDFIGAGALKDSSAGAGAGYEQAIGEFKNGAKPGSKNGGQKGGGKPSKGTKSTIKKQANKGGTKKAAGPTKSSTGLRGLFGK